jgi:hypothetical protein
MANDIFLGLIALGVLVMASIQVGAIVFAVRAARRVEGAIGQLQQDVRPIVQNLQTMSADAARVTSKAAAQVDRLEKIIGDLSATIDQTATAVQDTILRPVREGMAIFEGIKAAFSVFRSKPRESQARRQTTEEEDALFIG